LFVSFFVCQHDNFRTIKRRMMKPGSWVHCTKISPEFEFGVKAQRSWSPAQNKRKSAAFYLERSSQAPVGKSAHAV